MFKHIMVPVHLEKKEALNRALEVACDMAERYGARLTLVNVGGGGSAVVAHRSDEIAQELTALAQELSERRGVAVETRAVASHDPSAEIDAQLRHALDDLGADLVVAASHTPGWFDYIVGSHAGKLAAHAPVSVMVVRNPAGE